MLALSAKFIWMVYVYNSIFLFTCNRLFDLWEVWELPQGWNLIYSPCSRTVFSIWYNNRSCILFSQSRFSRPTALLHCQIVEPYSRIDVTRVLHSRTSLLVEMFPIPLTSMITFSVLDASFSVLCMCWSKVKFHPEWCPKFDFLAICIETFYQRSNFFPCELSAFGFREVNTHSPWLTPVKWTAAFPARSTHRSYSVSVSRPYCRIIYRLVIWVFR